MRQHPGSMKQSTSFEMVAPIATPTAPDGWSFNPRSGELNPSTGFFVSDRSDRELILGHAPTSIDVQAYMVRNFDLLHGNRPYWVGMWAHAGQWFLDVSLWFASRDDALAIAAASNQLAIFDCANGASIHVN